MKHSTIRVPALLLALLLFALSFAAIGCSNQGGDNTATTAAANTDDPAATQGETGPVYTFDEADYQNADFIIYQRSHDASSYAGIYITAEDVSDLMSEAVFKRNAETEDKYKVKISALEESDPYKNIQTQIDSNLCEFSVILDRRCNLAGSAKTGYLKNFNDLDIDYTTPWWDANCAKDYDMNGKLFFMANDVSVSNLAGARFFYFNKDLMRTYNLESPYDLYDKDEWNLEKFLSEVNAVHEENGDGVTDGNDVYGLCMETGSSNGNVMHLLVGCGIKFSEMENGTLTTHINDQKTDDLLAVLTTGLKNSECVITYGNAKKGMDTAGFANDYDFGRNLFANGHFLFIQGNMGVASQFANMEQEYGAIVNPKYNKDQKEYYHKMDRYSLIWAIPNATSCNYDMISDVMDYWAYVSSTTVMDSYYQITIKTRRVQDPIASAMLDKVKATISYDICADIYSATISSAVWETYDAGSTISAAWRQYKTQVEKTLADLVDTIDKLQ